MNPRVNKICKQCNKDFSVQYYRRKTAFYCSRICQNLGQKNKIVSKETKTKLKTSWWQFHIPPSHKGFKHSEKTKILMGIKAKERGFGKVFGKNHHNWKGGLPKCLDCNKKLSSYKSLYCMKCVRKGKRNSSWIEDKTQLKKGERKNKDVQYIYWSRQIKNCDNWQCKINNKDCKGRLESHHILNWVEYPELRYDINNGITLCHAHHPRGRAKEKRLSPYFTELVTVSKNKFES